MGEISWTPIKPSPELNRTFNSHDLTDLGPGDLLAPLYFDGRKLASRGEGEEPLSTELAVDRCHGFLHCLQGLRVALTNVAE